MTEIRDISQYDVQDIAEQLVRERGTDFVYVDEFDRTGQYAQCRNWTATSGECKPMCIVGTIIHRLNPEWLGLVDASGGVVTTFKDLAGVAKFSREAKAYLTMAQKMQDRGFTWAAAVEAAQIHVSIS